MSRHTPPDQPVDSGTIILVLIGIVLVVVLLMRLVGD